MGTVINKLSSDLLYSSALTLVWLLIWIYAVYILIKAKRAVKANLDASIVAQYEPPKNISPILAHFLLSFGAQGKTMGDLSQTGEQLMILITLYEKGLLSELQITEGDVIKVQYKINESYSGTGAKEEEKIFLDYLVKAAGHEGELIEETGQAAGRSRRSNSQVNDGFSKINTFWFKYWHSDLNSVTNKLNLTNIKPTNYLFLQIFATTLTFGGFFALFLFLFSTAWQPLFYLGLLFILPQAILFAVCLLLIKILIGANILSSGTLQTLNLFGQALPIVVGFSWFAWLLIFGGNVKKLYFRFNEAGKKVLQDLEGYRLYLKRVNLDRVDILSKVADARVNATTFPWLLVFTIANYKQWQLWHEGTKI